MRSTKRLIVIYSCSHKACMVQSKQSRHMSFFIEGAKRGELCVELLYCESDGGGGSFCLIAQSPVHKTTSFYSPLPLQFLLQASCSMHVSDKKCSHHDLETRALDEFGKVSKMPNDKFPILKWFSTRHRHAARTEIDGSLSAIGQLR
jgi:hypothetical protein